jgi:hypothetical protein
LPWSSGFDEAIPLPRGLTLVTLKDAGNYMTKLPKAEHEAPEWQAAMEALILTGGDVRRPDDACADWRHAGVEPSRRARVRHVAKTLGKAEAEERRIIIGPCRRAVRATVRDQALRPGEVPSTRKRVSGIAIAPAPAGDKRGACASKDHPRRNEIDGTPQPAR